MEAYAHVSFTDQEIERARLETLADCFEATVSAHDFIPGTFGFHEAFHTASVFQDAVDRNLCEHAAVALDPVAYRLAHQAQTALFNLYQYMGAKDYQKAT